LNSKDLKEVKEVSRMKLLIIKFTHSISSSLRCM